MNQAQIKDLQAHIIKSYSLADRAEAVDGFWGPKSVAAAQKHLRSLRSGPNPWPKTDQASLTAFYGAAGDESQLVNMPVPGGADVRYEGKKVKTIRCHKKVADSLSRIIVELSAFPEGKAVLLQYGGVYNNRPMRGGSTPSLHARGAAIDLDPTPNGNKVHWPTKATMSIKVMEVFAKEGWVCAGADWSRDGMHFQSTQ